MDRRKLLSALVMGVTALGWLWAGMTPAAAKPLRRAGSERPVVLHARFQQRRGSDLVADGRYVFISGGAYPAASGVLIDGRTGRQRTVSLRGCTPSALGGAWLAFTCGGSADQTFELYKIPTGHFQSLTATARYQGCTINCMPIVAVGSDWVAFETPAGDGHDLPSFVFQNLRTSEVASDPTDSTTTVDLDSPGLAEPVCRPLRVPAVSNPYDAGWGSLSFDNGFAIASGTGGTYLERCGASLHQFLTFTTPDYTSARAGCPHLACSPAANSHAIVWQSRAGQLSGIFLPSRQRFTIPVPTKIDPTGAGFANGDEYQLALTPTRLYLVRRGHIWSAAAPAKPMSKTHRRT